MRSSGADPGDWGPEGRERKVRVIYSENQKIV
jgi:hypothetical protein